MTDDEQLIKKFRELDPDEAECGDSFYQQFIDLCRQHFESKWMPLVDASNLMIVPTRAVWKLHNGQLYYCVVPPLPTPPDTQAEDADREYYELVKQAIAEPDTEE